MNKVPDYSALQEYQRKIKSGEVSKANPRSPAEVAKALPKSMRAAINAKCWNCVCENRKEVTLCEMDDCALWHLRPWQKKE